MVLLLWAPAICGMVSGGQGTVPLGSEFHGQKWLFWGRICHVVLGGRTISISVFVASQGFATPGAVQMCDQVVSWEILSLGQGLGCTGVKKPQIKLAEATVCRQSFKLVLCEKRPTLPRRSPFSSNA